MATVRFDNKSEDDIIFILDGTEYELKNSESVSIDNQSKGMHSVTFHRKRIPRESVDPETKPVGIEAIKAEDEKPGSHIQLDTTVDFEVNSSKSNIVVSRRAFAVETLHEDAVFVAYDTDISGAKKISSTDKFANKKIKKTYLFQQIKGAFLPVGIVGFIVLFFGLIAVIINLSGFKINLGSTSVTIKSSLMVTAGGLLVTGFFILSVIKIIKRAKELS